MVKFGKSKLKALNKLSKKQQANTAQVSNKILKKKQNAEKKVSFQKEVLLKEAVSSGSSLVNNVSVKQILLNDLTKKEKRKEKATTPMKKCKQKPLEKQKKRQKTQISDTKLLLNLMKKKQ